VELRWQLAPANEEYVCRYFVVPDGGLDVVRAGYELGPGSHHMLVWSTSLSAEAVDGFADVIRHCDRDTTSHAAIDGLLLGAQPGAGSFGFPSGAALRLRGGQVLLIEQHAINASPEPIEASATLSFHTANSPVTAEVGLLHYYNWAIRVAPGSEAIARMRCVLPQSVQLLFAHGHMHARGNSFRAWTKQRGESDPFYVSSAGDAPSTALVPAVDVTAADAIEFECAYANHDARTVYQGLSASSDEMCSFTAFYLAAGGRRMDWLAEGCAAPGSGVIGQGTLDCHGIESCLAGALASIADPVLQTAATQECWLAGCPAAPLTFRDFASCRATHCAQACGVMAETAGLLAAQASEPGCLSCLEGSCADVSDSCAASACEL
jgi:hypothetical protein